MRWAESQRALAERAVTRTGHARDLLRVAVLSRNLTFDRSWDVALASEARLRSRRFVAASRPLHDFLVALPQLATGSMPQGIVERVEALADQVTRTAFPAPDGFDSPIAFHAIGLKRGRRPWIPPSSGHRTLAVAPFVNRTGLDAVGRLSGNDRILVSRQEELDKLSEDALAAWKEILVLSDTAQGEAEDGPADTDEDGSADATGTNEDGPAAANHGDPGTGLEARPSGLHAKMIAVEHGWRVTWSVGSANLTAAAFTGGNVEMMASVTGKKGGAASSRTSCSPSGRPSKRRSHRSNVHEATIRRGQSEAAQVLSAPHGGARLPPSVHIGRRHRALSGGRRGGPRQDAGRPGHHRPRHRSPLERGRADRHRLHLQQRQHRARQSPQAAGGRRGGTVVRVGDPPDNAAAELAQELFQAEAHDGKRVRTLLLSATPYKLYTADAEIEHEEHYQDFLATTRFLLGDDDARVEELKHQLSHFGAALRRAAAGDPEQADRVERAKRAVEGSLRDVMARTERVAASDDRDAMVAEDRRTTAVTASDVRQYLAADALFSAVGGGDPMQFWKSAPYLAHFMHGYRFNERLDEAIHTPAKVVDALQRHDAAFLKAATLRSWGSIDPGHAKLRELVGELIDEGLWRLLWMPPTLPYWPLEGPFEGKEQATKRLLFSAWNMVPDVVSAVLSYEAERLMMGGL